MNKSTRMYYCICSK